MAGGRAAAKHGRMPDSLATLRSLQAGVLARSQLLEHVGVHDVRRMLRRRELVAVHPGVYVDHTGRLTWGQEAWAAVLALWPAALCHQSALRAADGPGRVGGTGGPVHVAIDRDRSPSAPRGVRLHRLAGLDDKVQWNLGPPRVRMEHAVLDVAAETADDMMAVAVLADAVQARRTTAKRLLATLAARPRIARRGFLEEVLQDVGAGTCSALEHGYLTRVERAHGLPAARRQVRESSRGPVYRDVLHEHLGVVVELDGRTFHDTAHQRDRDLDRDLDVVLGGRITVRLGWGQVFGRPCETAAKVGRLLQQRGWSGTPTACPRCRPSGERGVRYAAVAG